MNKEEQIHVAYIGSEQMASLYVQCFEYYSPDISIVATLTRGQGAVDEAASKARESGLLIAGSRFSDGASTEVPVSMFRREREEKLGLPVGIICVSGACDYEGGNVIRAAVTQADECIRPERIDLLIGTIRSMHNRQLEQE